MARAGSIASLPCGNEPVIAILFVGRKFPQISLSSHPDVCQADTMGPALHPTRTAILAAGDYRQSRRDWGRTMNLFTFLDSFPSKAGFGPYSYSGTWWRSGDDVGWRAVVVTEAGVSASPSGTLVSPSSSAEGRVRDAIEAYLQRADADAMKGAMAGGKDGKFPAYPPMMYSAPTSYRGYQIRTLATSRDGLSYASYTVYKKGWRRPAHAVNDLLMNTVTESETHAFARQSARGLVDLLEPVAELCT